MERLNFKKKKYIYIYIYIEWNSSSWSSSSKTPLQGLKVSLQDSLKHHHRALEIFFLFFFYFSVCYNSIVQKLSFKLKLDFQKIEFQNRGISLISLEKGAKCQISCFTLLYSCVGESSQLSSLLGFFYLCDTQQVSIQLKGY